MASAVVLLPLYIDQLTTEAYGALTIYMVFTFLVQILVTFSFDSSVYIHYHEFKNDAKKLSTFIGTAFVFMLITGAVVALILAVGGDLLFNLVLPGRHISFYPYGLASVGAGVFQAIFKVHTSLLQTREKPETFFWSNVFSFSIIAICIVIGLQLYPHSLAGPVVGRFVGSFLPFIWVLVRVFREFGIHYDFTWLRSSFSFNAYTFIYQIQQWIINQFDRVLMLFYLSLSDVGIYDFAVKCLIPIELLMNSLHNSFYPKVVSSLMGKTDQTFSKDINRYYHGLTGIVMLLVCGSVLTLPIIISFFKGKSNYHEAVQYIPYLGAVYFFRTMRLYFAVPYNTLKFTKPLPVIYISIVAIKIVLMLLLMRRFEIYGVVIASLVSSIAEVYLLKRFIQDKFRYVFNPLKIIVAPVALMLVMVLTEPFVAEPFSLGIHIIYMVGCILLLWWVYRNEVQLVNPFRSS